MRNLLRKVHLYLRLGPTIFLVVLGVTGSHHHLRGGRPTVAQPPDPYHESIVGRYDAVTQQDSAQGR